MKNENKKQKIAIRMIFIVAIILSVFYYLWQEEIIGNQGKLYPSKDKMCAEFAQSYLRTIQKIEPNFNNQKWEMAVDIETELHKLCTLDLTKESIKNYKPTSLNKYQN